MVSCEIYQGGSSGCMRIVARNLLRRPALVHQGKDHGKQGRIDRSMGPSATRCACAACSARPRVVVAAHRIAPDLQRYRRGRPIKPAGDRPLTQSLVQTAVNRVPLNHCLMIGVLAHPNTPSSPGCCTSCWKPPRF